MTDPDDTSASDGAFIHGSFTDPATGTNIVPAKVTNVAVVGGRAPDEGRLTVTGELTAYFPDYAPHAATDANIVAGAFKEIVRDMVAGVASLANGGVFEGSVGGASSIGYGSLGIASGSAIVGDGHGTQLTLGHAAFAPYALAAGGLGIFDLDQAVTRHYPDMWVAVKDGHILASHDAPFEHEGVRAVRYRYHG